MGLRLLAFCDELWVCGDKITDGMRTEIAEAERLGIRIVEVRLESALGSTKRWGIWAQRGPSSIFGSAAAWTKSNGKVLTFETYEAAAKVVDQYMKIRGLADVAYSPKEMEPSSEDTQSPDMGLKIT